MSRRVVLQDWKFKVKTFIDALQGDSQDKTINIIDERAEVEEINSCVDSLENLNTWFDGEIEKELELENYMLPEEGNPGVAVGE